MKFLDEYTFHAKQTKKVRKGSDATVLDSIKDQRRILKGETVKRNGKVVSSWEKDGEVTPRVSGLNLFDDGKGSNTATVSDYSTFLDKLEAAVKSGDLQDVIDSFDNRRNARDAKLRKSLGRQ